MPCPLLFTHWTVIITDSPDNDRRQWHKSIHNSSSCSFSCRQTPVRLAAIRFPGQALTARVAPRPQPPSAAPRPTRTVCWRAPGRSSAPRSACTAPLTRLRLPPARTMPTTSPTAPSRPPSTPRWWVHIHLLVLSMRAGGWLGGIDAVDQSILVIFVVNCKSV